MAKLSDIAFHFGDRDESPQALAARKSFGRVAIPVTEIFLSLVDRIVLDGRSKLNLILDTGCSRHQSYEPYPKHMGSISNYYIGGFDLDGFLSSDKQSRGDLVIELIENALIDVCKINSVDPAPYSKAADLARQTAYQFEYEVAGLSRSTKDRKVRLSIHRLIRAGEQESWKARLTRKMDGSFSTCVIVDSIRALTAGYEFRTSKLEDDVFSILDFQGRTVFSLSATGFVTLPFIERRFEVRRGND